jgi:hypothetical protein
MIIDRFGDEYESAIPLPQGSFVDEWAATRPPVTARAGQMNGAFDFYGTEAYPLGPLIVKKKAMLVGSSWENVGTLIDDLIDATIMLEVESKLWGLQNDGTTVVWCYAKCTNLTIEERATNAPTGVPISIDFFCREGIWYGGSESSQQYATDGTKEVPNAGTQIAPLRFVLQNSDIQDNPMITRVFVTHMGTDYYWSFDGDVPAGSTLVVDAGTQICTVDDVGAYADLTVGKGQSSWLALDPGSNSLEAVITPNTGIFTYTLSYMPIY